MGSSAIASLALLAALAAAVSGCGAGAGRSFDGSVYRQGPVAFQIPPPPSGWRSVEVTDGSLAYRDDANAATVLLNARCHKPDEGTPLAALTNHLVMGSSGREITSQETEPLDAREALHTKMRAKWDGVPVALDIFVMKKDGCIYDFVYMGAPSASEAGTRGLEAFEAFVRGFRTLPGSGTVSTRKAGA